MGSPDKNETTGNKNNEKVYLINNAVDYPLTLVLGGTSVYLLTVVDYSKKPTSETDILNLNTNNLPVFDRSATTHHSANLANTSNYLFYSAMPLPLVLLADRKIAKDAGEIGVLYLEAFAFEGILYSTSVSVVGRFRPDAYNTSLPVSERADGNNRNSFFAGHVAVVANSTFFISKVYNDYNPGSCLKWWLYGGSAAATVGMGYLRYASGRHFPSDIVAGALVGTACGLLVPTLHKNRNYKNQKWSIVPDLLDRGAQGFSFMYRL